MTRITHYSRDKLSPTRMLKTERLILKTITHEDCDYFWELESDPDIQKYIREAPSDEKTYKRDFLDDLEKGVKYKFFYVIFDKINLARRGVCILRPTEDEKWIEVGYKLSKEAWGKGLASEATIGLLSFAFKKWKADSVMAIVSKENIKSVKVLERAGLSFDRAVINEGKEVQRYVIKATNFNLS